MAFIVAESTRIGGPSSNTSLMNSLPWRHAPVRPDKTHVCIVMLSKSWARLHLQVVVHPRAHKLPEGIVGPLPDPAVNRHALRPEADGLRLEISLLCGQRWGGGENPP